MVSTLRRPSAAGSLKSARLAKLHSPKAPHAHVSKKNAAVSPKAATTPKAASPKAAANKINKKPASRRGSVQRSVPSSPQQQPAAAASSQPEPMQLSSTAADKEAQSQQPDVEMTPAESKQGSEVPAADEPAAESEPVYTPEEQKMLATINTVRERLNAIEAQLPTLRGQLELHAARLCAFRLARHHRSPTFNANKLQLSHKSLRYNAGLIDEQTMQAIFKLDAIQTDNASVRKERKATVARGNKIIADSVDLCKRIDKLAKWLPEKENEPEQSIADVMTDQQHTPEPPADAHIRPDTPLSAASTPTSASASTSAASSRPASPVADAAAPAASAASATPASASVAPAAPNAQLAQPAASAPALHPLQRKYANLRLPTWRGPQFVSRVHPTSGALLIQADLSGVRSDDVSVSSDAEARTLTIRGVKLPRRRPSSASFDFFGFAAPVVQEPYGHFIKEINFNDIDPHRQYLLQQDKISATMDADSTLTIFVPRAPVVRRASVPQHHAQQQQQQHPLRRPAARAEPVHFTSGYDDADDDEEEQRARAYYAQQRQQQQHPFYAARQAPRAQSPMHFGRASPFFGGNGWW